jgi:hypothetical protein
MKLVAEEQQRAVVRLGTDVGAADGRNELERAAAELRPTEVIVDAWETAQVRVLRVPRAHLADAAWASYGVETISQRREAEARYQLVVNVRHGRKVAQNRDVGLRRPRCVRREHEQRWRVGRQPS